MISRVEEALKEPSNGEGDGQERTKKSFGVHNSRKL